MLVVQLHTQEYTTYNIIRYDTIQAILMRV